MYNKNFNIHFVSNFGPVFFNVLPFFFIKRKLVNTLYQD